MTTANWVTAILSGAAILLSLWVFLHELSRSASAEKREKIRDDFERRSTEEAAETQRRLLEIDETRHRWEQEQRDAENSERRHVGELARTARFAVRFGFRDSARTWARVIATNDGPAVARDVSLTVFAEVGGSLIEIEPIRGEDYRTADRLERGESVHVGIVFTLASPGPDDLRYKLTWIDDRGEQVLERQVPVS